MTKNFILWETNTSHADHNANNPDSDDVYGLTPEETAIVKDKK